MIEWRINLKSFSCRQSERGRKLISFQSFACTLSSYKPHLSIYLYKEKPRVAKGQVIWIFAVSEWCTGKWLVNDCRHERVTSYLELTGYFFGKETFLPRVLCNRDLEYFCDFVYFSRKTIHNESHFYRWGRTET